MSDPSDENEEAGLMIGPRLNAVRNWPSKKFGIPESRTVPSDASDYMVVQMKKVFDTMGDMRFDQLTDEQWKSVYYSIVLIGDAP